MQHYPKIIVKIVMPRNRFFMFLVFLLVCAARIGFAAQDGSKNPDDSKESSIVTSTETHLRFASDGSSVKTQTTSIKVLSEAGVHAWGVLAFGYAAENEHVDVHFVRVHKADDSTVSTPAESVLDLPSDVTRVAPMYSDLKQKQIPVKALGVGDTLEFEIAYVEDKPLVPGQFWYSYNFTRAVVVLKEIPNGRARGQPKVDSRSLCGPIQPQRGKWVVCDLFRGCQRRDREPILLGSCIARWSARAV